MDLKSQRKLKMQNVFRVTADGWLFVGVDGYIVLEIHNSIGERERERERERESCLLYTSDAADDC